MNKPKERRIQKVMSTLTEKELFSILKKLDIDFPDKEFTFEGNKLSVDGNVIEENDYILWHEPVPNLLSEERNYLSAEHCAYLHWYAIVNNQ